MIFKVSFEVSMYVLWYHARLHMIDGNVEIELIYMYTKKEFDC